jgi:hypothetical protein
MYTGYNWFGKCRKSVKDKGGIVMDNIVFQVKSHFRMQRSLKSPDKHIS